MRTLRPAGEKWVVCSVLADSDTFGVEPTLLEHHIIDESETSVACRGGDATEAAGATRC